MVAHCVSAFAACRLISARDNSLVAAGKICALSNTCEACPQVVSAFSALSMKRASKLLKSRASPFTTSLSSGGELNLICSITSASFRKRRGKRVASTEALSAPNFQSFTADAFSRLTLRKKFAPANCPRRSSSIQLSSGSIRRLDSIFSMVSVRSGALVCVSVHSSLPSRNVMESTWTLPVINARKWKWNSTSLAVRCGTAGKSIEPNVTCDATNPRDQCNRNTEKSSAMPRSRSLEMIGRLTKSGRPMRLR